VSAVANGSASRQARPGRSAPGEGAMTSKIVRRPSLGTVAWVLVLEALGLRVRP